VRFQKRRGTFSLIFQSLANANGTAYKGGYASDMGNQA
jgi:hypothetical protein